MKFRKLLVLGALLITSSVAKAVDANVWPKPTIAAPEVTSFTTYEVGKTVYLYNVASHLFFTSGNDWGTRASLIYATNGNGSGATTGEAICGVTVEFTQTDEAKAMGDDVVELKSFVPKYNEIRSAFADGATSIWTDNNSNANRFWKVTAKDNYYLISNVITEPDKFLGWEGEFTDTRLNLIDEAAGTQWKMVEEAAYNDWLAAVEANGVSIDAFNAAVAIYNAAMRLKEVLVEAEAIGAEVTAELAVYNNTNSTLDELNAAITSAEAAIEKRKQEQAQSEYENATVENPVDVTSLFVKNPSYENNKNDGWEGSTPGFQSYTNAEFYQAVFDTHQSMTGLREGIYMLALQAFYRPGWGDGTGYTAYVNKDQQIYDVKMYANSGSNQFTKPIVTAYEGAGEKVGQGSETAVPTADGSTIYIPNDMNSAAGYFAAGRYYNSTLFEAEADNTITIGLKNSKSVAGNWVIYDNWKLIYMGAGDDAYKSLATAVSNSLPDYSNLDESVVYTQSVLDAYLAAKDALANTTGKDAIKAAIATAKEAAAAIELNIELWQKYQDLCKRAMQVAANEEYNESARESLADYEMDLADNLNARILTNEELQALCDEIEAAIDNAIRTPKDGADITDQYLVNAGFDTNDDTGWIGRGSITDIAHSAAEAYQKNPFDLYQEVKNAPIGVYEISLQGFYRAGSNDDAWPAYRDAGNKPGVIPAQAWVYLNQKQTELNNCYDVQVLPYNTYDLTEGYNYLPDMVPYGLYDAAGDSIKNADGDVVYVPNNMSQAQDAFMKGYYTKSALGLVAKEGDPLRIGIKGNLGSSCWAIWDNFRLIYRGFKADVVREVLVEEMEKVESYKSLLIGKNVRDIIDQKLAAAEAVKNAENGKEMFSALTELFTVGDTVRASEAIFAELETAYEKLTAAILDSKASNETILQATNLQNDIYNNVFVIEPADVQWTDEKATEAIGEIDQMIKNLSIPDGMEKANDENPMDVTTIIKNPTYDDGNNIDWTLDANPGFNSGVIEVYNANFNEYQDIDLPAAGTYEVGVQGFYRYGFADKEYETYTANPEENNNMLLYVKIGDEETTVPMPRLASDGSEEYTSHTVKDGKFVAGDDLTAGNEWMWSWMTDPVAAEDSTSATGIRIINGMIPVASKFAEGKFAQSLTFKIAEPGTVRIGLKKEIQMDGNWCIWDSWKLTYFGANSSRPVTGIDAAFSNGQVVRTEFFNLSGARINAPRSGVMIIKQTMADGTLKVRKVVVK